MINITFPDGAVRQYEQGSSALDIAKQISEGLARKVLAADVNGEVWDATRPINNDAAVKFLTWDDDNAKSTFWHSSAHLMAEAVESLFPGVKFWVGPATENPRGFYYDMDLGDKKISEEDLIKGRPARKTLRQTCEELEKNRGEAFERRDEAGREEGGCASDEHRASQAPQASRRC